MDQRLAPRNSKGPPASVSERESAPYESLKLSPHQQQYSLFTCLQRYQGECQPVHNDPLTKTDARFNCLTVSQSFPGTAWVPKPKSEHADRVRTHWNKEKGRHSAVASSEVKQRLHDFVLKKQRAALRQCDALTADQPGVSFRAPPNRPRPEPMPPHPGVRAAYDHTWNPTVGASLGHYPLRKTASEPNLKLRPKLKPSERRRRSPLVVRRKASAPAGLRRATADGGDSSPVRGHTTSGQASPNSLQLCETESRLIQSNVTPQPVSGDWEKPSACRQKEHRPHNGLSLVSLVPPTHQVSQSAMERDRLLAALQPVIILEPGTVQNPLLAFSGLGTAPLFYTPAVIPGDRYAAARLAELSPHRPLGRTQSAPLPQSPRSVQQKLQTQQLDQLLLERLKQQTHLGKLMSKRRLSHGEEGESERKGPERGGPSDRPRLTEDSTEDGPNGLGSGNSSEAHRPQVSLPWDLPRVRQKPPTPEVLGVIDPGWAQHRPLSRARSSPASAGGPERSPRPPSLSTGLVYDSGMLKHQCTCGNSDHLEHPGRIQSIYSRLQETGLKSQCECVRGRKATFEEIRSVHTESHVLLFGTAPPSRLRIDSDNFHRILSQRALIMLPCGGLGVDSDTVWNENHTPGAARLAVGCTVELALKVASGQLKNGFAIVRPPGHHAEASTAMGFCFFNSVAVATKQLLQKTDTRRILIVDWDVHHGNSTQQVFYSDPKVLYISLHRHDGGNFFPGSGAPDEVGSGPGEGFNVNIAWSGGLDPPLGDADYLAAFRTVVIPIAMEFSPDLVLVSSGFDAVEGHQPQMGGYRVSAKCFGELTRELMDVAGGRVVLVLEGGHHLTAICDASEMCVRALLGQELEALPETVLSQRPTDNAIQTLERVIEIQSRYWKSVQCFSSTAGQSGPESRTEEIDEREAMNALASLSVGMTTGGVPEKRMDDEPMDGEPMDGEPSS